MLHKFFYFGSLMLLLAAMVVSTALAEEYRLDLSFSGNEDIVGVIVNSDLTVYSDGAIPELNFPEGSIVTLEAITTIEKIRFCKWSGDAASFQNPLNIVMDSDKSITANYVFFGPCLMAKIIGNGSISLDSYYYADPDPIKIRAAPDKGWEFAGWQGDLEGSDNPGLIGYGDYNITAVFAANASGEGEEPLALRMTVAFTLLLLVMAMIIMYARKKKPFK